MSSRPRELSPNAWATASPDVIEHFFVQQLGHVVGLGDASAADSIMSSSKSSNSGTTVSCQDLRTLESL